MVLVAIELDWRLFICIYFIGATIVSWKISMM